MNLTVALVFVSVKVKIEDIKYMMVSNWIRLRNKMFGSNSYSEIYQNVRVASSFVIRQLTENDFVYQYQPLTDILSSDDTIACSE